MKQVIFTDKYTVAEFPQYGGRIIEAEKGDVELVSFELADLLIHKKKKAKTYQTPEETENEEDKKSPPFLNPATKDKEQAEN